MANQDEDKLAGTEAGWRDNAAQAEGAVSTEDAAAPEGAAGASGAAAADQRGPDGNGHPGPGEPDGPAGGGAGPAADLDNGTGPRDEDDAPAGQGGDPRAGDAPGSQPSPGLARPAGFAAGYAPRDPRAYPASPAGGGSPGRGGEGTGAEPAGEDPGSVWTPGESRQGGAQASPYAPYGEYDPYPGHDQGQDYGRPQDYDPDQGYGQEGDYDQGQGYPPGSYGQPYPPAPEYAEQPGYGPPDAYGEDQGYDDDAGYGQAPVYGQEQPYPDDQDYGPAPGYDPGYGQPGYPPDQPYGRAPYPGESYGPGQGQRYGPGQGYAPGPGYPEPDPGHRPEPAGQPQPGPAAGPDDEQAPAGSPDRADGDPADAETRAAVPGGRPGRAQAQPPDREQASGAAPYPPQDADQWRPPYEAPAPPGPAQAWPGRYDPRGGYGGQPRGPYGDEMAYPPPPRGPGAVPAGAEALAPLPVHDEDQERAAETADDLTAEALLPGKRQGPGGGWRRLLYKGSGGLIRPRESAEAMRRRDLVARVRTPVAGGHHRVAVMSLKGGVGKTTTTVGLGAMLASLRGDRIIALDANPDRGTLSDKVRLETSATVRDLLNERSQIQRYADVRAFTSQAPSRLEVLASDRDPTVSVAFCEEDYYDAARVLEHYYSISLIDCGTGLLHSAMAGVLQLADQIVLVSSPSVDGARSASATLDWLDAHEYGDLVRNAVVVLSMIKPRSKSTVDLDRLENHFASRCRAVARIPYDAHLEEGAEVDLELMSPATVNAYLALAATVGDGFAWPRRAARQPGPQHDWSRQEASNGPPGRYR